MNEILAALLLFQGVWAGDGQARIGPDDPYQPASCSITIEWTGELSSRGRCTGPRGEFAAGGEIAISGGTVTGTFMRPFLVETDQEIELRGNTLVVTTTYVGDDGVIVAAETTVAPPQRATVRNTTTMAMTMTTRVSINGAAPIDAGAITLYAQ